MARKRSWPPDRLLHGIQTQSPEFRTFCTLRSTKSCLPRTKSMSRSVLPADRGQLASLWRHGGGAEDRMSPRWTPESEFLFQINSCALAPEVPLSTLNLLGDANDAEQQHQIAISKLCERPYGLMTPDTWIATRQIEPARPISTKAGISTRGQLYT